MAENNLLWNDFEWYYYEYILEKNQLIILNRPGYFFVLFQHVQKNFRGHFFLREGLTSKNRIAIFVWLFGNDCKKLHTKIQYVFIVGLVFFYESFFIS